VKADPTQCGRATGRLNTGHETRRFLRAAGLAAVLVGTGSLAHAQADKVNGVIGEQVKVEQAAQASQKRVDTLDSEASTMLAEYRQANAEIGGLKAYNDQLAEQVKSQEIEMATMTRQLGEIETTSREALPMMQKMVATLDDFVKLDLPFLTEERANRIAALKDMMTRADVSVSEKYRRIVEAYQIEIEYGRTIEAYQGKVGDRTVDFLRAGRVALLYQALDGSETGYWDAAARKFVPDDDYEEAITAGLKVAKKQAAPDFISVPVAAPKEVKL
jgi:chromosome segregation ATPase